MFSEDDLLPISGLQHLVFCPRQCALIHIEKVWADNMFSAKGQLFHEKVHNGLDETQNGKIVLRSLRLSSKKYGLYGFADVVELNPSGEGIQLSGREGFWLPTPVEYKRGKPKKGNEDKVQLCAQALCIEETWEISIPEGFLFYGKTRHREVVCFSCSLRSETVELIDKFHELISLSRLPPAQKSKKCRSCSLIDICQPDSQKSALRYLSRMLKEDES